MWRDVEPNLQPQGTYVEAFNMSMRTDDNFALTNEKGTKFVQDFGGEIVGYVRVPDREWTIFFVKGQGSELWIYNHRDDTKTLVVRDSTYGCTWNFDSCEHISAEIKRMHPCDQLNIYWSSNCIYYTANIDLLLDPKRNTDLTCDDFFLMDCTCGPMYKAYVLEGAGKDLPPGAYQFSVQMEDKDGNTTNWFTVGQPVYLGSESNNPERDERSVDGVALRINRLSNKYTRVNVAAIRTVGGALFSDLISTRTYNTDGVTVEYTSLEQAIRPIPLEEVLIKKKTYIRGRRLFQKDGRLFLYQLQQEKNLNYQRQANNIITKYVNYKVPATEAWRFQQLMRDEVYAFGIVWEYCDGTYSPAFHIPNNVAKPAGETEGCNDCPVPYWLQHSMAVREQLYCPDETGYPLDEVCYCPPNAVCNENCTVVIPDLEEEEGENCANIIIRLTFPPGCNNRAIQITVDYTDSGVVYGTFGGNPNPPFTINGSGDSNPTIITIPMNSSDWSITQVRVDSLGGCTGITWTYEVYDCDFEAPADDENIESRGEEGGSEQSRGCVGGFCGGGSGVCTTGGCSGGTCSGAGCRGGGASRGGDIPYDYDVRTDIIHSKEYDREACRDAGQFVTDNGDIIGCAECAAGAAAADGPIVFKRGRNYLERLRDLMRKDDDVRSSPSLNTSTSLANASGLICDSVENLERQNRNKATLEKGTVVPDDILTSPTDEENTCVGSPIIGDDGCTIIGYNPVLYSKGSMGYWESQENYPLDKDCDGEYIYGDLAGTPIRHHKTPDANTEPIYLSRQTGVENFMEPDNFPTNDTDVFVLGAEFSNIVPPSDPPKPICGYRIVMVKREGNNRSVIAKGLTTHTFKGIAYGKEYAIPKHGVNSWEYVDRHIENATDENHLGEKWREPIFGFHSPDTNTFKPFLNPNYFKTDFEIFGGGFKYGNYAEGASQSNPNTARLDRRGVRQAVNLNRWDRIALDERDACIEGITYAPENSVVKKAEGIDYPIMNKYREHAVYFQTDKLLRPFRYPILNGIGGVDPYVDYSFIGDGVDHPQPVIVAAGHYGALKSYNKAQYGNIESMRYVGTGLDGSGSSISGVFGDTYIGLYSFKRSGYVSNKVGDILNEQFADIAEGRITRPDYLGESPRSVCMPANRNGANLEEDLGLFDHTSIPTTGDTRDPKNMASLHPTRRWKEIFDLGIVEPESDVFYPRTVTTLIHFWCESEINMKFRGSGDAELGEIFYPVLKGKDLDSEMPPSKVADNGWLNDFHQRVKRISKTQLATRAALRAFVKLGLPAIFAGMFSDTTTGLDLAGSLASAPVFIAMWIVLERFVLSIKNIDKFLGIAECLTDEGGAEQIEDIQGWKDNFHRYSLDYSKQNDINLVLGVPAFYNTCECDDCDGQYTNEVYYSNKQLIDSAVDAYKNFNGNDYLNIPAHTGRLQNLFVRGNRFYAHTTDAIWVLQYANVAVPTDNGTVILGQGSLLNDPQQMLEGVIEGYGGIQHPKSAINTVWGYFFIDEEAKKLYRFGDEGLRELHTLQTGMTQFFRNHILPCKTDCKEMRYKLGIDFNMDVLHFSNGDYTISYSPTKNVFVSFHSFTPEMFIFDRNNMYSVKEGKLWLHGHGERQNYYGEVYPSYVEFVANQADARSLQPFIYESTMVDSSVNLIPADSFPVYNLPKSFTRMAINNTHQQTGVLEVKVQGEGCPTDLYKEMKVDNTVIPWNRTNLNWDFNRVRNFTKDPKVPLFVYDDCRLFKDVNTANIDCSQTWDITEILSDKYMVYKMIFDTLTDEQIVLRSVMTRIKNYENKSNG